MYLIQTETSKKKSYTFEARPTSHYSRKTSKTQHEIRQLPLFIPPVVDGPTVISIEPVPSDLRLGKERFYIWLTQGDLRWKAGIQLLRNEAECIMQCLSQQHLSLDEDKGCPNDPSLIYSIIESVIDGGAA